MSVSQNEYLYSYKIYVLEIPKMILHIGRTSGEAVRSGGWSPHE